MQLVAQLLVNGLMVGGMYAFIALGIVMIFKATGVFNFAVGAIMLLGAFLAWLFMDMGISPVIAILLALIIGAAVGFLIERVAMHPLIGQPMMSAVIATLAIFYILSGILSLILTERGGILGFSPFLPGKTISIAGLSLSNEHVWSLGTVLLMFVLIVLFTQRTKTGLAMRATAEDHQLAQARGIPVGFVFSIVWAIAAIVSVVAGIFLGLRISVQLELVDMGLKAFPAVLLGGLESIPGCVIGGLAIGLIESLTAGLIDPAFGQISPFIVLMLVLIFRTEGLFGLKRIERI